MNHRMAGQHLLDQGGSGTRQPEDEHGTAGVKPGAGHAREDLGRERGDDVGDEPLVVGGLIALRFLFQHGLTGGVGLAQ